MILFEPILMEYLLFCKQVKYLCANFRRKIQWGFLTRFEK